MDEKCVIHAPFLMEHLTQITWQEEQKLCEAEFDKRGLYTSDRQDVLDGGSFLGGSERPNVVCHPRFQTIPPHRHNYIEMMYVCQGTVTHEIRGRKVRMVAGDMLLMNQYTTHMVHPTGAKDFAVNVMLPPRYFDETYELIAHRNILSGFIQELVQKNVHSNYYLLFHTEHHLPVSHLMEILLCTFFPHADGVSARSSSVLPEVIDHLMFLLFSYLSQDLTGVDCEVPEGYEQILLETIERYIIRNYRTATLSELAGIMNQSESGLSRQIKNITGATFKELLQARRFDQAIILLKETNLSVSDVALSVGYENSSYFYRRFKEIYGISPREYRIWIRDVHRKGRKSSDY